VRPAKKYFASQLILSLFIFLISQQSFSESSVQVQTQIVDCLLPVQDQSELLVNTAVKVSAAECKEKNGEYSQAAKLDIDDVLNVWQSHAIKDDPQAQFYIAEAYELANENSQNFEQAVHWYRMSAANAYAPALMSLARLYENGIGVKQDFSKAISLYQKAEQINSANLENQTAVTHGNSVIKKNSSQIVGLQNSRTSKNQSNTQTSRDPQKMPVNKNNTEELENNLQALELAEEKSQKLQASLQQLEEEKFDLNAQSNNSSISSEPVITFHWPEFENISGVYRASVASGSVVKVIGALADIQFVEQLAINEQEHEFDKNGLFLKSVEVIDQPVYLDFLVKDRLGKTLKQLVVIEPEPNSGVSKVSLDNARLPNLEFGKYYALVIGNSDYKQGLGWDKLNTTINDAHAVAQLLTEKFGFEVTTMINVNHDRLLLPIENIRRQLTANDNLLIYYAGHGYVDPENDQGYWIPVDASTDSSVKWVSNSTITDQIRAMTARNVMVVADSCYSATLMRSGLVSLRSGFSVYKKLERLNHDINTITRVALSAGGLQPVADSINGSNHSVFANAFISVLNDTSHLLDSDALATKVGMIVSNATKESIRQLPRYAPLAHGGHQGGDFYFVPINWKQKDI